MSVTHATPRRLLVLISAAVAACGGATAPGTGTGSVEVTPSAVELVAGGGVTFTAATAGVAAAVDWSVKEVAGGTVSASGAYLAPQVAGTYHVVAASHLDPAISATATVTVDAAPPPPAPGTVAVSVSPKATAIAAGATFTFTAAVTGSTNGAVSWVVQEGAAGGGVSAGGVYTAPAAGGVYHVVATSQADGTKSDSAAVTVTAPPSGGFVTPSAVTGEVVVAVDASSGTKAISPWIYGANGTKNFGASANNRWFTLNRAGGNQMSDFNWEDGYTNSGDDFGPYFNANPTGEAGVGQRVRSEANAVYGRTGTMGNALLMTIPLMGYVSGPWQGNATPPAAASTTSPGTPAVGTSGNTFRTSAPYRVGDAAHASATATPSTTDSAVYQDDFLKWFDANLPGHKSSATEPIFLSMDGEPDSWGNRHHEVRGTNASGDVITGFQELLDKTIPMATTVKDMLGANALVFGPVTSGWGGMVNLNHPSGDNPAAPYSFYMQQYLKGMSAASAAAGKRLLDVLDTHWYPEAETGTSITYYAGKVTTTQTENDRSVTIREQTPRSLWDPSYREFSWITYWNAGMGGLEGLQQIPRMKGWIDQYYPSTQIGFTEWWYGAGGDVSSAIAAADTLGIFGREGVFQASAWDQSDAGGAACFMAGFGAFINYDGAGGHVGDTYAPTVVTDASRPADPYIPGLTSGLGQKYPAQTLERVTAYASYDAATSGRAVIVAINKTLTTSLNVGLQVKFAAPALTTYDAYRVTGKIGSCTGPTRVATNTAITGVNAFNATLPPQSITVFVLKP